MLGDRAILALPGGDGEKSWAGKKIIPLKEDVKVYDVVDPAKQREIGRVTDILYLVLAEKPGCIRVRHRGEAGWIKKDVAILQALPRTVAAWHPASGAA